MSNKEDRNLTSGMEGRRVPDVTFRTRVGGQWVDVTSAELFDGKNVIVFSLPGAFTPTCSSSHVPRFDQLAPWFREHGIDEIICVSVNDAFVMQAWQEAQKATEIRFLPDGNGEFTERIGMLVDKADLGFGKRSWRYSMLVRDGIIVKMFVEPQRPGDPFEVSDADTMRAFIAPQAAPPHEISVFARAGCSHCERAKRLLRDAGLPFDELLLNRDYGVRTLGAVSGARTFPQIFADGTLLGGADALEAWLAQRAAA